MIYFAAAALTTAPLNPLTLEHGAAANRVVSPFFVQNWQLFAPDPMSEDRGVVARVRCSDGTVSGFTDITSEHVKAVHDTRLFPSRMSRITSNGVLHVFLQDPYLSRFRETASTSEAPEALPDLEQLSPEEREIRLRGERTLVAFAADTMEGQCVGDVEAVQLRYMIHRFPRWSERENWRKTGDITVLEAPWSSI